MGGKRGWIRVGKKGEDYGERVMGGKRGGGKGGKKGEGYGWEKGKCYRWEKGDG